MNSATRRAQVTLPPGLLEELHPSRDQGPVDNWGTTGADRASLRVQLVAFLLARTGNTRMSALSEFLPRDSLS